MAGFVQKLIFIWVQSNRYILQFKHFLLLLTVIGTLRKHTGLNLSPRLKISQQF